MILLLACVTKSNMELVEVQLDATRTALSAKNAACYNDIAERDAAMTVLQAELDVLRLNHKRLTERHAQLSEEVATARDELAALTTYTSEKGDSQLPPLVEASKQRVTRSLATLSKMEGQAHDREQQHTKWLQRWSTFTEAGFGEVVVDNGHTVLRIPTKVLYNEGTVDVSPRGEKAIAVLKESLSGTTGEAITIQSHTDDRPYHTALHNSSWELGLDQATILMRALGPTDAVLTVGTAAGSQPVASNDLAEGRDSNRRIELWVRQDLSYLPGM